MSLKRFLILPVLLGATIFAVGCSDDDPTGPDFEVNKPATGSTYTYSETTNTGGPSETIVATVLRTDASVGGKTGVYQVEELGETDTTLAQFVYENNGDILIYFSASEDADDPALDSLIDPIWLRIPFGSKSGQTLTPIDTTIDDGSGSGEVDVKMVITTAYVGKEEVTVDGEKMDVIKASIKIDGTFPLFGIPITITATEIISFAPEIGYIYKSETTESVLGIPSVTTRILTSYDLK